MTRRMRCGCGFLLEDDEATIEAFNEHVCTASGSRWHESLFSIWGVLAIVALAGVVAAFFGGK